MTLAGKPYWPIGMNAYQLGTNWSVNEGCGAQVDLEGYFAALPPKSLTRIDVFSTMAVNKSTGQLDFTALDAVFEAANRHGQMLIAVLTGDEGACEHDYFKDHDWYAGGWRTEISHEVPMSFGQWLDTAVGRWGGLPVVAGWTAVGEAEPTNCGPVDCDWHTRECPSDSTQVLRAFFDESGNRIRRLDPDAMVWGGRAGGGQCGSQGEGWATIASSPGVDVLEYHDYEPGFDFPGDADDGLQRRIEQAHAVDKPLVVTELGMEAGACLPPQQRKDDLHQAVTAQRAHGTAGVLFWAFVPDPRQHECTLDIGPADPLFALLGAA